jgi:signal transduction histidine kinase
MYRVGLRPLPALLLAATVLLTAASIVVSVGVEPAWDTVFYSVMSLALGIAGSLIASRERRNPIGWLLSGMAVIAAIGEIAEGWGKHASWSGAEAVQWFSSWSYVFGATGLALVFALFPSGRFLSRRWRPFPWVLGLTAALIAAGLGLGHEGDDSFNGGRNPYAVEGIGAGVMYVAGQVLLIVTLLAAIVSLILRYRRSTGAERQQLKWVAFTVALLAVVAPFTTFAYFDSVVVQIAIALVVTAIPAAICVAILRYRLYDIDLVISRTLAYGLLTVLLLATYVAVTLLLGTAISRHSAWVTAAATLAAAAAFRPLRIFTQNAVERRFRRPRYLALRKVEDFLDQLRSGLASPESVEAKLREVLMQPELELRFVSPDAACYVNSLGVEVDGRLTADRASTPIEKRGILLAIAAHSTLDDGRQSLFRDVLDRAGLAIEIARLGAEVRRQLAEVEASRARIISAGYEERRRLERDLHDGAQQRLVSIGLALRHAQHELGPAPSPAMQTIESAVAEIGLAITDLRSLANGVRPAYLDSGLFDALHELARRTPLPVLVQADAQRYPADIEAAAYFIVCEAVTNAVKHASATTVLLRATRREGLLEVCVKDDGIGGAQDKSGSGLRGLMDRVAAHGGRLQLESAVGVGTTVTAELPCAS